MSNLRKDDYASAAAVPLFSLCRSPGGSAGNQTEAAVFRVFRVGTRKKKKSCESVGACETRFRNERKGKLGRRKKTKKKQNREHSSSAERLACKKKKKKWGGGRALKGPRDKEGFNQRRLAAVGQAGRPGSRVAAKLEPAEHSGGGTFPSDPVGGAERGGWAGGLGGEESGGESDGAD